MATCNGKVMGGCTGRMPCGDGDRLVMHLPARNAGSQQMLEGAGEDPLGARGENVALMSLWLLTTSLQN